MRILLVSDVYFPRVNGVSTAIETHRRGLMARGIDVTLIAPRYDDEDDEEGIIRLPGWKIPGDPEDRIVLPGAMRRAVMAEAARSDLIHVQTPFSAHYAGLAAARAHRIPVVATYHTLFEEYLHHYARWLPAGGLKAAARSFSRRQCNALDGVIVPSTAMAERLQSYGVTTPLRVVPTGIPLQQFGQGDGAAFRQRLGLAPETPVAVITAFGSAENAVAALKAGAFDYLSKPVGLEQLRALVKSALRLPEGSGEAAAESPLIGDSATMQQVRELIDKLARSQAPIYVSGESGSARAARRRFSSASP